MEQLLLYQMKHLYRAKIELVRKDEVVPNVQTGRRTVYRTVHCFDAVFEVTNNWLTRTFNRTDVDVNTKGWLIDPRDLPDGYEPTVNDTVQDYGRADKVNTPTLKGIYNLTSVENVTGGILIVGRRLAGADQPAILTSGVIDDFIPDDNGGTS